MSGLKMQDGSVLYSEAENNKMLATIAALREEASLYQEEWAKLRTRLEAAEAKVEKAIVELRRWKRPEHIGLATDMVKKALFKSIDDVEQILGGEK